MRKNNLRVKIGVKVSLLIFAVLLVDQRLKFWVKLNMIHGESFDLLGLSWAKIYFVENEGMAFGWEFGGDYGKLLLTSIRMLAVPGGFYFIHQLIKKGYHQGLVLCAGLIVAGAMGNLIDSIFYGEIFSHSYGQLATLFPEGGGYETFLHGRVVDMFYFPLLDTTWPEWFPYFGGKPLRFFQAIFNVADSSISIGVAIILLFQSKLLKEPNVAS
jgi:signal peptidase II